MIASTRDLADCMNGNTVNVFDTSGHGHATSAIASDRWLFWIDLAHVCYSSGPDQSSILDTAADLVTGMGALGMCIAAIPGGLGG